MSDAVLEREQAHLAASRLALRAMRDATARNFAHAVGGNALSTEILKQSLYRRMRALEDDPDVPLFFGRLDYATALGAEADECLYVGRRHVAGELGGDPLVMDWRANMAVPFYRASPGEPMGVELRRRFGFSHGRMTGYSDEHLGSAAPHQGAAASEILLAEIERPRIGPMRDIVATIQPDQDLLVRCDLEESLCIQGAPGTGKTAVGLHRAAYLLYAYRDRLARSGVAVIGPNQAFLGYIADVLPALGEIDVRSDTLESLLTTSTGARVGASGSVDSETLKGDARLASVCAEAVWRHLASAPGPLVIPWGSRLLRLSEDSVNEAVEAVRGLGVRYETGRALLAHRLAHAAMLYLERLGDTTDDRVGNAIARHASTRAMVEAVWPKQNAAKLLFRLLSEPGFLADCAVGVLDADEQAALAWAIPPKRSGSARWTLADLVLLDELGDLLNRTPSLGHVIVDEAQDLSPMMLRAVGRRATTGSLTVLGDLAQATTPWGCTDWATALGHLGRPHARVTELIEGFRVPGEVLELASRLLPSIAPALSPPRSVRSSRGELTFVGASNVFRELPDAVARLTALEGSIGIIVPDALLGSARQALASANVGAGELAEAASFGGKVELVAATLAKGLEFDHVVLIEPADIVDGEHDELTGLRRLYVCLTRAVTSLTVLHSRDMPGALDAA